MLTISNGTVLYGENLAPCKANVLIDDGKIIEISKDIEKGRLIDASGCIVLPALINSHVHLGDSIALDQGDGFKIQDLIKPPHGLKHRLLEETDPQEIINKMRESMLNMLATGTGTFIDFREGGIKGLELINKASENIPLRKIILGRPKNPPDHSTDPEELVKELKTLLKNCDGIGLSGFGEIDDNLAKIITNLCKENNKLSSIHVAEYEEVQEESIKKTKHSEVERAFECGFKQLVHLTYPHKNDLDLVAHAKIPVVCCPRSNGSLGVGIPPLKKMIDMGINILLGTDNLMFNSPNMFREMEYALKVARGSAHDYLHPLEVLKSVTVNAGKALGLNLGCLKEDYLADIIIVEQLSPDPILSLINRTEICNLKEIILHGKSVAISN